MRIVTLTQESKDNLLEDLLKRSPNNYGTYEDKVAAIVDDVRKRRNEAVFEYTEKFDHAKINASNIRVTKEELEEERRLFYVGMTRAKDKLYLYYAKERYGQELSCSRFIEELRGDGTPKPGQGEKRRQTI